MLLLLLLLMQLALGLLRRLSVTALLHSFALDARFICLCSAGRRRDLLAGFGWCACARLALFGCAHMWSGRRRAELLRRRALLVALRWCLFQPTTRGICLIARPTRWLPTPLLLLRPRLIGT